MPCLLLWSCLGRYLSAADTSDRSKTRKMPLSHHNNWEGVRPHRRELKQLNHCNETNIALLWYGGVANFHLCTGETSVDPSPSY